LTIHEASKGLLLFGPPCHMTHRERGSMHQHVFTRL